MTLTNLKNYLTSIRSGGQQIPQINDIVDAAIEAGFAQTWGAYAWKVRRTDKTTLVCTVNQAYTILPDDMESIDAIVLLDGTSSWWIDLQDEGNFEINFPNPSGYTTGKPVSGKVVFNSAQQGDRWRLYWDRIPGSAYSLRVIYQRAGTIGLIPQLPSYMLAAVVDRCLEYVLPPGNDRLAQHQAAEASLQKAIQSDETVSGPPRWIGVDPGFNDGAFVGSNAWDGGAWLT